MDKFEEMMQKMQNISDGERTQMMDRYRTLCICSGCPTFNECMRGKMEVLFCLTGKSSCIITKKACICPNCPITYMMGFTHAYYCSNGTEKEQRKK